MIRKKTTLVKFKHCGSCNRKISKKESLMTCKACKKQVCNECKGPSFLCKKCSGPCKGCGSEEYTTERLILLEMDSCPICGYIIKE